MPATGPLCDLVGCFDSWFVMFPSPERKSMNCQTLAMDFVISPDLPVKILIILGNCIKVNRLVCKI